jgi:hypothetical protein
MQTNLDRLKGIFGEMPANGFDINEPLKWGFFFFDSDRNKLNSLYDELKDKGYENNGTVLMEDNKWRLFVTKIEILTPEKLHSRNNAFNELAEYCSVELYDGWDVEKV